MNRWKETTICSRCAKESENKIRCAKVTKPIFIQTINGDTMDNTTSHASSEYDASVRKTIPYYELFHEETISLVRALKPRVSTWLDTGCGTGNLAQRATQLFPDTHFFLADPSIGMIGICRKKLAQFPNARILEPCGSENLPVETLPTMDVVTAIQSHHYSDAATRRAAVGKCFETLSPGGVFIAFENIRPDTEEGTKLGLDRWAAFLSLSGQTEEFVRSHRSRFGTSYFPIKVSEHLGLLADAGFSTIELFWFSCMQAGFYAIK
jgi:tRNA (cmo5U34)-methyltransferase